MFIMFTPACMDEKVVRNFFYFEAVQSKNSSFSFMSVGIQYNFILYNECSI